MNSIVSPIILFVYKRPQHTKQTVESLLKNNLAGESDLFIYSDAAKSEKTQNLVVEVRKYLKTINGFKDITIIESEINLGLASSVTKGVSEVVNHFGKAVILEDDMLLSPFFLKYMNEALSVYEEEEKVISIHGYVYPVKQKLHETFFLRGADCWGWATWKRGWKLYENDAQKLLSEIERRKLESEFNFNDTYDYMKMLKQQIKGEIDSWAIKWYASAFINDRLTLYPGRSLVKNIGADDLGTHLYSTSDYDTELSETPIKVEKNNPEENKKAYDAFAEYFRTIKPGLLKKGIIKARTYLKKR